MNHDYDTTLHKLAVQRICSLCSRSYRKADDTEYSNKRQKLVPECRCCMVLLFSLARATGFGV